MRARWVETRRGDLAIFIAHGKWAAKIRFAFGAGGYAWRRLSDIRRRRDLDHFAEPDWLTTARASPHPSSDLYWLLDLVPAPPDDLPDRDLQKDFYEQPRLERHPHRATQCADRDPRAARAHSHHHREGADE